MSTTHDNELLGLTPPLFELVGKLLAPVADDFSLQEYRDTVVEALELFTQKAADSNIEMVKIQDSKFAIVALLDELAMASELEDKTLWLEKPLQLEYFAEHVAGEGFFQRLDDLLKMGIINVDVIEVYYACLELGFEGIYRLKGVDKLRARIQELRVQISAVRGNVDTNLRVNTIKVKNTQHKGRRPIPYWIQVCALLSGIILIYIAYDIAIDWQVDKALVSLDSIQGRLSVQQAELT